MKKRINQLALLTIGLLSLAANAQITGRVVNQDGNPVRGAVLYDITDKMFKILNNETTLTEHLTRSICDKNGYFTLESKSEQPTLLARDLDGSFSLFPSVKASAEASTFIFKKPASLIAKVMHGPFPKADAEIIIVHQDCPPNFRYTFETKTDKAGEFRIENMLPGKYVILLVEDIPTIGCLTSVVTKQKLITLSPGETRQVQLGGDDLPFLAGTVTSTDNELLHGVWVKLVPAQHIPDSETSVWAAVTDPNGHYSIYDIPPGKYALQCIRRLAKNTPTRFLREEIPIQIESMPPATPQGRKQLNGRRHTQDIQIDLEPFMPLAIGQKAPDIETQTIAGNTWSLKQHRGKIVVVHFYISRCIFCRPNIPGFEKTYTTLQPDVEVVGVSLDKTPDECQHFINQLAVTHPQIFEGGDDISNQYRVAEVPTSFIIDREGNIAQIDLFGETLIKFIKESGLLRQAGPGTDDG